jgi:hypothetical protein
LTAGIVARSKNARDTDARQAALCFHLSENVDLDRAGEHLPPSLQKGLQPGISSDLLTARLE